jgi:hypothetical protein
MNFRAASLLVFTLAVLPAVATAADKPRKTEVSIAGDAFHVNGKPTYEGRKWKGHKIEGLLFNSRMVQATFDDLNPKSVDQWAYADTGKWDSERNTREFIAALPEYRRHGLLGVTLNLQGGSPQGYSQDQPWHNSALREDGTLRDDYLARLEKILDRLDELGMVAILGVYYFGQDERMKDEAAVIAGVDATVDWVLARGYRNVLIEINNECNIKYDHKILQPRRVHELIERAKSKTVNGRRLLVGTSYGGGAVPQEKVVRASDFLLIHANGQTEKKFGEQIRRTREVEGYRPMPVVCNEDDHFDFDQDRYNLLTAVEAYVSWGYFDFRRNPKKLAEGYQSVPVDWGLSSDRKRQFFGKIAEMTGAEAADEAKSNSPKANAEPKP